MKKMNTKTILVSFLAIAVFFLALATVSAGPITNAYNVEVDGENPYTYTISVVEGQRIDVEVSFTAINDDKDVTVRAELNGEKEDVEAESGSFTVENGSRYKQELSLRVPYGLKDKLSDNLELEITIEGEDHETELATIVLKVQRESYNVAIKSITVGNIQAGQMVPVDVVIKNNGYHDLEDVYVTAKISALDLEKTTYIGDLVAIEDPSDDDETDTISGRLFLEVPYTAKAGVYALEIEVSNSDMSVTKVREVTINNEFSNGNVLVQGDSLIVVNPTNQVLVYRLVPSATNEVSVSLSQSVVAVPAGSSRTVDVTAVGVAQGTYAYTIDVFSSNGELLYVVNMTKTVDGSTTSSPIVVLTVILAIIFVVLLVVLVVLLGKKPEKTDEFGESYY